MQIHSGDPEASSSSRGVHTKDAFLVSVLLVAAQGRADPGHDLVHRLDVLIGDDEDSRLICLDGPEFHQALVVSSAIKSDRYVLGPVLVDEKDAA